MAQRDEVHLGARTRGQADGHPLKGLPHGAELDQLVDRDGPHHQASPGYRHQAIDLELAERFADGSPAHPGLLGDGGLDQALVGPQLAFVDRPAEIGVELLGA